MWLEMLQAARLEAHEHGWRRPWDGSDGEAFHAWPLKHELKLSGVRVAPDPDPFVKPEVMHVLNLGACMCSCVRGFNVPFYLPSHLLYSLLLSHRVFFFFFTFRSRNALRFSLFHFYFLVSSISLSLTHYRAMTTTNKTNSIGTTPNCPKAARRWADLGWTNTTAKHICVTSRI